MVDAVVSVITTRDVRKHCLYDLSEAPGLRPASDTLCIYGEHTDRQMLVGVDKIFTNEIDQGPNDYYAGN